MTKREEIERLKAFVAAVPDASYLHGFLAGAVEAFGNAVAQDLSFPTLMQIWSDRQTEAREAAEERKRLDGELSSRRAELLRLEKAVARNRTELDEIRAAARRLAAI